MKWLCLDFFDGAEADVDFEDAAEAQLEAEDVRHSNAGEEMNAQLAERKRE